jgi:hypothetical protein
MAEHPTPAFVVGAGNKTLEERNSMTNRFMISVAAAALLAGTGLANAQGMSREGGATGGSSVQQSAPSSERGNSAAPAGRDAAEPTKPSTGMKATQSDEKPSSGMKATQSDDKAAPGAKNLRAQDDLKAGTKTEKSAQDNVKGEKSKGMSSENDNAKGAKGNLNAEQKGAADSKSQTTTQSQTGQSTTQSQTGQNTKSQTTTGNAATSATAAPPPEKQTQIVSAIKSERIEEINNVNFELNVGARVPTNVRFHPLPPRIVEIYPEWRGYEVIRVRGKYVIVRPQTHEIVYIIEG